MITVLFLYAEILGNSLSTTVNGTTDAELS